MVKFNFQKVEEAFDKGLEKMFVSHLIELADQAQGRENKKPLTKEQRNLLIRVGLDVMRLQKKDKQIFEKLQFKKSELKKMVGSPEKLSEEEWKTLEKLGKKAREMVLKLFPQASDEELIEKELERHATKRFNVNEKWLPLD